MKNLLIIFFLFLCYNVVAQNPSGIPTQFSTGWFRQGWHQSDSGEIIASRIPNFTPKFAGTTILYQQAGVDSTIHYWTGGRWVKINPIGTDTTSLSNRINLKLNISDTANKWWGIGKRWVDTVYRVNDSTIGFTINDGAQQTFEIKGGASGGGGSGTVTSVGLSLPSAFNVTPSSITTSGTFAVTGAGTTSQFIRGNGTLATTDTGMIPNFYLKVRGLLTGTSPITFNQFTGGIGILNANNSGQKGAASFTSEFSDNGSGLIDLSDLVSAGSCTGCILNINAKGRITGYSDGPAGATNNVNIGAGFRILNSTTQQIKTLFAGAGTSIDSVSNTDGLTLSSQNISNASLTADGTYTQNWNNTQWYVDSISEQFLFRMGGVGSTGTRRKDFRLSWGGSSFGDNLDGYNIMTTINKADNSGDSLRLGLISSGTGVLSMGYYDVANPSNNNFISYSTAGLINISARDSIWIKGATPAVTADSVLGVVFRSAGVSRIVKIPLSAAGGGATLNNIGAGFRWVATPGGNIKTVSNSNTILWDSTSTANTLTAKADTSVLATQYDLTQLPVPSLQSVTDVGNTTTNDIINGSRINSTGRFSVEKTYTTLNQHSFDDYSTLNPSVGGTDGFASFDASTELAGTVNTDHYIGYQSRLHYNSSGNLTGEYGMTGLYIYNQHTGAGTIPVAHGIYIRNVGLGGGPIDTAYGIRIRPVTVGTENYGVRSEGGKNSFVDEVMIGGHTTPIAKLDVRSSTYDQTLYCDNTKAGGYSAIFNSSNGSGGNIGLDITASGGTGNKAINFGPAMTADDWNIYSNGNSKGYIAGKVGIGSGVTSPDSTLQINGSFHNNAGVRMEGLPTSPGTKAVRIDANGNLSIADTTTGGGGATTIYNGDGSISSNRTVTLGANNLTFNASSTGDIAFTLGSDATGDTYYRSAGGVFTRLAAGADGDVLTVSSGLPSWQASSLTTLYNGNGTLSGNRNLSGDSKQLNLGIPASKLSGFAITTSGQIFLQGQVQFSSAIATDANYSINLENTWIVLPEITANRTVSLTGPSTGSGKMLIIWNKNSSGNSWSFTGGSVIDAAGSAITNLTNDTVYYLMNDGTDWVKIN